MIRLTKRELRDAMQLVTKLDKGNYRVMVNDILEGDGHLAKSYLVKEGFIVFTKAEITVELIIMKNRSIITLEVFEQTMSMFNAKDALYRLSQMMKNKKRIQIID